MDNEPQFSGSRSTDQFKDVPEWKRAVQGGTRTGAVGKKIVRSILEQRQALPIFRLKDELMKVSFPSFNTIMPIELNRYSILFVSC